MSEQTPQNAPPDAIARDAKSLPVMLPGKLIGRESVLAQIYAQVKEDTVVQLHGTDGVGKTALAATLANAYTGQSGGVLWMNVNDPPLDELLIRVGRAYDIREITNSDTPPSMISRVAEILQRNKPFIVLDGTISADVAGRFISRCANNLPVIITTHEPLEGPWNTIEVTPLETEQAVALFKREGRVAVNQHDDEVADIVEQVQPLPFSLTTAARAMAASKQTPETFLKRLEQVVSGGTTGPDAALNVSFRALNGALQGLLLMIGATFNASASSRLLSMISGAPLDSVEQAMNILTQLNLVNRTQRSGLPYYYMHPITHHFVRGYLERADKLDGLQNKVRDMVVAYAQEYSQADAEAHAYLMAEMETFIATARWAAENGDRQVASNLAKAVNVAGDFVSERGYLYETMRLREISSGDTGAFPAYEPEPMTANPPPEDEAVEDDEDEAEGVEVEPAPPEDFGTYRAAESVYDVDDEALEDVEDSEETEAISPEDMTPQPGEIDLESADLAELRNALGEARQSGDTARQLAVLQAIGKRQVEQGMENEAISTYNEALSVYEEQDDQAGALETLDMLSALMVRTGNAQAAVMHATRGITLAENQGQSETQMALHITLGDAHQQLGESGEALADFSRALTIARDTGDRQHEAIALHKLGYAQLDDGDANVAIETFEEALKLFREQEKRQYEGRVMGGLGSAYGDLGRWSEAVSFHTSALYIAREVKDKEEEALQLSSLAYAALQAGQLGDALLRYRQALHLAFQAENKDNIVSTVVELVRLLLRSRKHVAIAEMLIEEAMQYEPNDKDIVQLKEQAQAVSEKAEAKGTQLLPVNGDARQYAANGYKLLEE